MISYNLVDYEAELIIDYEASELIISYEQNTMSTSFIMRLIVPPVCMWLYAGPLYSGIQLIPYTETYSIQHTDLLYARDIGPFRWSYGYCRGRSAG